MTEERYSCVDVSGVTGTHARACRWLLGGSLDLRKGILFLPTAMTGSEVRGRLGLLWRGVSLRNG